MISEAAGKQMGDHTSSSVSREFQIPVPFGVIQGKEWGNPNGAPLLGVHGWLDNAGTFDHLAPLLPLDKFRFVCFDIPGYGRSSPMPAGQLVSSTDDTVSIQRVVKHLKWSRYSYIGHSMGASLGVLNAAFFPSQIDKMVLLDWMKPISFPTEKFPERAAIAIQALLSVEEKVKRGPPSYTWAEMRERQLARDTLLPQSVDTLMLRGARKITEAEVEQQIKAERQGTERNLAPAEMEQQRKAERQGTESDLAAPAEMLLVEEHEKRDGVGEQQDKKCDLSEAETTDEERSKKRKNSEAEPILEDQYRWARDSSDAGAIAGKERNSNTMSGCTDQTNGGGSGGNGGGNGGGSGVGNGAGSSICSVGGIGTDRANSGESGIGGLVNGGGGDSVACGSISGGGSSGPDSGDRYVFSRDLRTQLVVPYAFTHDQVFACLSAVKCKVLFVKADDGLVGKSMFQDDNEVTEQAAELLRAAAASFEQVDLPGKHHFHLDHPELLAPVVNKFLLGE